MNHRKRTSILHILVCMLLCISFSSAQPTRSSSSSPLQPSSSSSGQAQPQSINPINDAGARANPAQQYQGQNTNTRIREAQQLNQNNINMVDGNVNQRAYLRQDSAQVNPAAQVEKIFVEGYGWLTEDQVEYLRQAQERALYMEWNNNMNQNARANEMNADQETEELEINSPSASRDGLRRQNSNPNVRPASTAAQDVTNLATVYLPVVLPVEIAEQLVNPRTTLTSQAAAPAPSVQPRLPRRSRHSPFDSYEQQYEEGYDMIPQNIAPRSRDLRIRRLQRDYNYRPQRDFDFEQLNDYISQYVGSADTDYESERRSQFAW